MSHTPKLLTLAAALVAAFSWGTAAVAQQATVAAQASSKGSFAMVAHLAVDGVAEIVAATPNGQTLFYTSADAGVLGVVDITNPARPVLLPRVDVRINGVGEPTSVAISPDGTKVVSGSGDKTMRWVPPSTPTRIQYPNTPLQGVCKSARPPPTSRLGFGGLVRVKA